MRDQDLVVSKEKTDNLWHNCFLSEDFIMEGGSCLVWKYKVSHVTAECSEMVSEFQYFVKA